MKNTFLFATLAALTVSFAPAEMMVNPSNFATGEEITHPFATFSISQQTEAFNNKVVSTPGSFFESRVFGYEWNESGDTSNGWQFGDVLRVDFSTWVYEVSFQIAGNAVMEAFDAQGTSLGLAFSSSDDGLDPLRPMESDFDLMPMPGGGPGEVTFFSPNGDIAAVEVALSGGDFGEIGNMTFSPIPEPTTVGLLLVGILGLLRLRSRK